MFRRKKKPNVPIFGQCCLHDSPCISVDALGHHWCELCASRYRLMEWGTLHSYPAVCVENYRIMQDIESWEFTVLLARMECIEALLIGLRSHPDQAMADGVADPLMQAG